MTETENIFRKYKLLRSRIDKDSERVEKMHAGNMQCKAGCDKCCIDYSILPVEFYSVLNDLREAGLRPEELPAPKDDVCVFLKNHICTIYEQRPVICRTHGLPLLYMNNDSEWELSVCELNFTDYDFAEFNIENTFPQDKYNSELFMLNREFIKSFADKKYDEFDLIPIKDLLKKL